MVCKEISISILFDHVSSLKFVTCAFNCIGCTILHVDGKLWKYWCMESFLCSGKGYMIFWMQNICVIRGIFSIAAFEYISTWL